MATSTTELMSAVAAGDLQVPAGFEQKQDGR
jgi:hypothetical protein